MKKDYFRRIGAQVAILSIVAMTAITAVSFIAESTLSQNTTINELQDRSSNLMETLDLSMQHDQKKITDISNDSYLGTQIASLLKEKNTDGIKKLSEYYISLYDIGHIAIADKDGNLITDVYKNGYAGKMASINASDALSGKTTIGFYYGNDIKLSYRSVFPVKDSGGNIICAIVADCLYDDYSYLDNIHDETGAEYTIFLDDSRINTTIMNKGQRYINSKLSSEIAGKVLKKGEIYKGQSKILDKKYMTEYRPIKSGNEIIGVIFCGSEMNSTVKALTKSLLTCVALLIIMILAISVVIIKLVKKYIGDPIEEMSQAAVELAKGNLDVSIKYTSKDDIGMLANGIRDTISNLREYVNDITCNLDNMASGDFQKSTDKEYKASFAPIKKSLVKITDSLSNTFESIRIAADEVSAGSEQVATGAQLLSQGSVQQASSIEQLSDSISQIAEGAKNNAESVQTASQFVQNAKDGVAESNEHMENMLSAMSEINNSSSEIRKIIKVIDDIAFQTNILALNAAVEAARAGSAGKGFAVVSDEVRNLASKSADAARQTTLLIEGSVESVKRGTELAEKTAASLHKVNDETGNVVNAITEIKFSTDEQSTSVEKISEEIASISDVVQTNSSTSEESAAASQELSGQAIMLKEKLAEFKLKNDEKTNVISSVPNIEPVYNTPRQLLPEKTKSYSNNCNDRKFEKSSFSSDSTKSKKSDKPNFVINDSVQKKSEPISFTDDSTPQSKAPSHNYSKKTFVPDKIDNLSINLDDDKY